VADYSTDSVARRRQYISFSAEIVGLDLRLIALRPVVTESEWTFHDVFNWLRPFDYQLWVVLIAMSIFTSMTYFYLEFGMNDTDFSGGKTGMHPIRIVYLAACAFVNNGDNFSPSRSYGKLMKLSWGLVVLVATASYTANLANTLISEQVATVAYGTLKAATAANKRVCVVEGIDSSRVLRIEPSTKIAPVKNNVQMYEYLREERCVLGVRDSNAIAVDLRSLTHNEDCSLYELEDTGAIDYSSGAFAMKTDVADKCSSFFVESLNSNLLALKQEGWLDQRIARVYNELEDFSCVYEDVAQKGPAMEIKSLSGIFIIHSCVCIATIIWATIDQVVAPREKILREQYAVTMAQVVFGKGKARALPSDVPGKQASDAEPPFLTSHPAL